MDRASTASASRLFGATVLLMALLISEGTKAEKRARLTGIVRLILLHISITYINDVLMCAAAIIHQSSRQGRFAIPIPPPVLHWPLLERWFALT